jgi:hypothetical protein
LGEFLVDAVLTAEGLELGAEGGLLCRQGFELLLLLLKPTETGELLVKLGAALLDLGFKVLEGGGGVWGLR